MTAGDRYLADRFKWAAPGDRQHDVWLARFDDNDIREMVFEGPDAEAEAWAAWERHAPGYNMRVFRLAALAQPRAAMGDGEALAEWLETQRSQPIMDPPWSAAWNACIDHVKRHALALQSPPAAKVEEAARLLLKRAEAVQEISGGTIQHSDMLVAQIALADALQPAAQGDAALGDNPTRKHESGA